MRRGHNRRKVQIVPTNGDDRCIPEVRQPMYEIVAVLIHGTFARGAPWTRSGSLLHRKLTNRFGKKLLVERYEWTAKNTATDRSAAADKLVEYLQERRKQYPGSRQYIIAHSHGGTVAVQAHGRLPGDHVVDGIACLSTPFLYAHARDVTKIADIKIPTALAAICTFLLFQTVPPPVCHITTIPP